MEDAVATDGEEAASSLARKDSVDILGVDNNNNLEGIIAKPCTELTSSKGTILMEIIRMVTKF